MNAAVDADDCLMHIHPALPGAFSEITALLLAATCAGCDDPGTLLCSACRGELEPMPHDALTPGGLRVQAALEYGGVAARCIRALKGGGQTHLARPLGAALATVLGPHASPATWIVPVPTSRSAFRRRGYRVPEMLVRRAGEQPQRVLSAGPRPVDQRQLGASDRAVNVRGSMRARRLGAGAEVVLVDDVVTTGATIDEAFRAATAAGFIVVATVALAATPRRSGFGGGSS